MHPVLAVIFDVLYTVFITPLTAGNVVQSDGYHGSDTRKTDGSLSSMVTIACLTAITFVVIGIYAKSDDSGKSTTAITAMTFVLTAMALLAIVLIAVLAFRKRHEWFIAANIKENAAEKFKGKFLWLFSLGIIMKHALELAINIDCFDKEHTKDFVSAFMVVHIVSILYYCIQTGFISYFKDYKFQSSVRINYGILIVLLTNLTLWFTSIVGENEDSSLRKNDSRGIDEEIVCFHNSTIQKLREDTLPFLNPCGIEYALLATSFMLSLWPSVKKEIHDSQELEVSADMDAIEESCEEYTPLLRRRVRRTPPTEACPEELKRRSPISFFLAILFGLILNLPVIISTVLVFFDAYQSAIYRGVRYSIMVVYKLSMLIMVFILFHHITKYGKPNNVKRKLSSTEYILVFANAGTIAVCTFDFIVSLNSACYILMTENIIDIILTFLQTTLIMHSTRITIKKTVDSVIAAEYVCLLLSVCNIVLWVGDSFNNMENRVCFTADDKNTKTNKVMKYVVFPILVFYRFHASIDLFGLFSRMTKN
ncbi:proton channel OtopLc-like [Ostrea edulis]|uniref:proton channel OtopLc-like n=1 Tax=Ostrea edulis TaxID=37623 RepID=UPI0024AE9957|nr:proton channel OtopLc-like [Ostrea edulis]